MSKISIISTFLNSFEDSEKFETKQEFGETLYNKLLNWESIDFNDSELEVLDIYFTDSILGCDNLFDFCFEDDNIYYPTKKGMSNQKLGIHFIFYYEDDYLEFFEDFKQMEKEFWNE